MKVSLIFANCWVILNLALGVELHYAFIRKLTNNIPSLTEEFQLKVKKPPYIRNETLTSPHMSTESQNKTTYIVNIKGAESSEPVNYSYAVFLMRLKKLREYELMKYNIAQSFSVLQLTTKLI